MPVVRLSDATWERMKRYAEPLTDSPDDVVRKLLDIAESSTTIAPPSAARSTPATAADSKQPGARLPVGLRTPNREYRLPILRALTALGGRATSKDVLRAVFERMKGRLSEYDLAQIPSGHELRWRKAANFERYDMVHDGLLSADSPQGIWEITDRGRELLKNRTVHQ